MQSLNELERQVHTCEKCKGEVSSCDLPYPPVYSFGNPQGKEIIVVGLNPSCREYTDGFLLDGSHSIEERHQRQLEYFERRPYKFFDEIARFFQGEVKYKLRYDKTPWEKVGYLDLVKCPTRAKEKNGQWSNISKEDQETLISNCKGYLLSQLKLYKPKIVMTYGAGVGRRFSKEFKIRYEEFEDSTAIVDGEKINIIFVPQRQGPHSKPEIIWVQNKILKALP